MALYRCIPISVIHSRRNVYLKNGNRCVCDVTGMFQTRFILKEKGHVKYVTQVATCVEITVTVCGSPLLALEYIASMHD